MSVKTIDQLDAREQQAVHTARSRANDRLQKVIYAAIAVMSIALLVISSLGIAGSMAQLPLGATVAALATGIGLLHAIHALRTRYAINTYIKQHRLEKKDAAELLRQDLQPVAIKAALTVSAMGIFLILGSLTATGFLSTYALGWSFVGTLITTVGLNCCREYGRMSKRHEPQTV